MCGRETGIVMKIDTVIGEIHMYFLQKLSIFLSHITVLIYSSPA